MKVSNIASPLNYIGGKYEMIDFIKSNMPRKIETFVDAFGGGFNVGVNIDAKNVIYNDINFKVKELIEMFYLDDSESIINYIEENIRRFDLKKSGKEEYLKLREEYNSLPVTKREVRILYLLLLYGFQQQLRFNSKLDYNNPIGQSGYNDRVRKKIIDFSHRLKVINPTFLSIDFMELLKYVGKETFYYCDPPYLITLGSYNDGKRGFNGWSVGDEKRMMDFLDRIDTLGSKFMLSNVIDHKGKTNLGLSSWVKKNKHRIVYYDGVKSSRSKRKEVLIMNY